MSDATEIQFHTHALMDVGVSDASHLVLSPELPGAPYALTAEAIRSRLKRLTQGRSDAIADERVGTVARSARSGKSLTREFGVGRGSV